MNNFFKKKIVIFRFYGQQLYINFNLVVGRAAGMTLVNLHYLTVIYEKLHKQKWSCLLPYSQKPRCQQQFSFYWINSFPDVDIITVSWPLSWKMANIHAYRLHVIL